MALQRASPSRAQSPQQQHAGGRLCLMWRQAHARSFVRCRSATQAAPLKIASRPSKLAQAQTLQVQQMLMAAAQLEGKPLQLEAVLSSTTGDLQPDAPFRSLGLGAFTRELNQAVADGRADMAVHSLKDCVPVLEEALVLACCLPREEVRDVLIAPSATKLGELAPGSHVGTSSARRRAQLLHAYPHLRVTELRGNVDARLQKMQAREIGATILAAAGLKRLGREQQEGFCTTLLSIEEMLPAACQGAVGVVCRRDDPRVTALLARINHMPTFLEVAAERACLAALLGPEGSGDGQQMPPFAVACHAHHDPDQGLMDIDCLISDLDGKDLLRYTEFYRFVSNVGEAEDFGSLYGHIMRHVATSQGWIRG